MARNPDSKNKNEALRREAADALHDLGSALVAHEADDAALTRIAILARALRFHLEQGPRRRSPAAPKCHPPAAAPGPTVTPSPVSEMA